LLKGLRTRLHEDATIKFEKQLLAHTENQTWNCNASEKKKREREILDSASMHAIDILNAVARVKRLCSNPIANDADRERLSRFSYRHLIESPIVASHVDYVATETKEPVVTLASSVADLWEKRHPNVEVPITALGFVKTGGKKHTLPDGSKLSTNNNSGQGKDKFIGTFKSALLDKHHCIRYFIKK